LSLDLEKIGSGGRGKRAKDFPTLHDDNIDKIINQFDSVEADLASKGGSTIELEQRVSVNEADIFVLQTQLPAISAYLAGQIGINAGNTTLLSQISGSLQSQIKTNANNIVSLTNAISAGVGSSLLGTPTDGTFMDGALSTLSPTMLVADAIDAINEFLLTISPVVPTLQGTTLSRNAGETGKIGFGSFNQVLGYINPTSNNTNDLFTNSGSKAGIFNASTTITGNLADGVIGSGFDNNAFGKANQGTLVLKVNNNTVGTVNLSSTTAAIGYGAGSGFSVSAVKYATFESGNPSVVPYRTGTYRVLPSNLVKGSNTIVVQHTGVETYTTNSFELIVDDNVEDTSIVQGISGLSMGGIVQLSGVKYHTAGSLVYYATIQKAYKHTYSSGNITHPVAARLSSVPTATFPGVVTNSSDPINLNQTISIDTSNRILNDGVAINTNVPKTLTRSQTFSTVSGYNLLVDPFTTSGSSNTVENFCNEGYRMYEGAGITTNTTYSGVAGGSPFTWNSSANMSLAGNEQNGLIFYNGSLKSPKNTLNNGNFSSIVNGPSTNANYSGMTGNLTFLRYFYFGGALGFANFTLSFTSSGTSFGSTASGNTVKVEAMIPGTGTDYGTWFDCSVDENSNGIYASQFGNSVPTNWGISFPAGVYTAITKAILLKITANVAWTGDISRLEVVSN